MKLDLSNPKWQGAGVILALLGTFVSIFLWTIDFISTHNNATMYITITPVVAAALNVDKNVNISYVINGVATKDVTIYQCNLQNTGGRSVSPSDFIEPVHLKFNGDYRLLAVADNLQFANSVRSQWTSLPDNTYELKPLLLNAGDNISLLLFVTSDGKAVGATFDLNKDLTFSGRILGVSKFKVESSMNAVGGFLIMLLFKTFVIVFVGWRLYTFLFGSAVLFYVTTLLFVKGSERSRTGSGWMALHMICLLFFSFSTTEIVVFISAYGTKSMDRACYPLLIAHFIYLLYLFVPKGLLGKTTASFLARKGAA